MHTLFSFLTAILILVSLHELGHLITARLCGVKVHRFSVGFGTPFFKKKWRNIEWCLAPIPLGGYVKMLDTREGNVSAEQERFAFDKQHPFKRILIVLAGPLTNLVLAILLYASSFSIGGIHEIKPWIGTVSQNSVAAAAGFQSGDRILTVNGNPVNQWHDIMSEIMLSIESDSVDVVVQTEQAQTLTRTLRTDAARAERIALGKESLGMNWFKTTDFLGRIQPGSPAEKSGLQTGDKIIAVNGENTPNWQDWSHIVRTNAGRNLQLTVLRNNQTLQLNILPDAIESPDKSQIIGRIGVAALTDQAWQKTVITRKDLDFQAALQLGTEKVGNYIALTFKFLGKLLTGQVSSGHLSGPISIADAAGQTAKMGWQPYIEFLALVSTSLGIMNLLPIPMLDGGHLVFYTAEWLRGKPLSQRIQQLGLRLGAALMLTLMGLAFFNDITRLFG